MLRKFLKGLALTVLGVLLFAIAFVAVQSQRRPLMTPYQSLMLPEAGGAETVRVRFAGVTTLLFDDGETAWMTDGFFSRPGLGRTLVEKISPDIDAIERGLERLGVTQLAAVVPVHSHYDHAMDAPVVAQRTGALLVGSPSTMQIGRGLNLAEDRLREVKSGDTLTLGRFTLQFLASRHSPTPYSSGEGTPELTAPLVPPVRAMAYSEGTVWSLVVTHAAGGRWLVQGSAGIVPGALANTKVDTVFLGVGALGKKDDAYREAYWQETVRLTGAKRVVAVHWDDFWLPLDQPLQAMPRLFDDLDVVMSDLTRRGTADGVEVRLPPTFTPFAP